MFGLGQKKYRPVQDWIRQLGTSHYDSAQAVSVSRDGSIFIAGTSTGQIGDEKQGQEDAWLAKFTATGEQVWLDQLGSSAADSACTVSADSRGYVYIAGTTSGQIGDTANAGGEDAWMAKYDGDGKRLWIVQVGSSSNDHAYAIDTDLDGNIYMAGTTFGALEEGKEGGDQDAWIAKFNSDGQQIWLRQLGSSDHDTANAIAADDEGNVIIGGYSTGERNRAWISKFDSEGKVLWTQEIGHDHDDRAHAVTVDVMGNVYVAGTTSGRMKAFASKGGVDAWVGKFSPLGKRLWLHQLGSVAHDQAFAVSVSLHGEVYVAGSTSGDLDGEGGDQKSGDVDAWVAKYDNNGKRVWTHQLGTVGRDHAYGLATDAHGNFYVAGATSGSLSGDDENLGGYDAWVARYHEEAVK